jgi:hypothetical protein
LSNADPNRERPRDIPWRILIRIDTRRIEFSPKAAPAPALRFARRAVL